jgi:hypothetical protein
LRRPPSTSEPADGTANAVVADIADAGGTWRAIEQVRQQVGGVDVLVNAAGTDVPEPVAELSVDAWDRELPGEPACVVPAVPLRVAGHAGARRRLEGEGSTR